MSPLIKRSFGLIAFLAITMLLAAGARGGDSQGQAPAVASQADPAAPTNAKQEQLAQEQESGPCQAMMGKMGMPPMGQGGRPGMGMMGPGGAPGMGMMGPGGMGMPGTEMGGMGMMPMMHEHMMMRMMARNPKLAGKMMQMRADIMRAVADVLTKYGKEMESGQWPAPAAKSGEDY